MYVPPALKNNCSTSDDGRAWLQNLPLALSTLTEKWQLKIGAPFENATCAWVTPVTRADNNSAILKIGWPHFEGRDEIDGLRFWAGDPTVLLVDADPDLNAMLLETCEPGTSLRRLPTNEQDIVVAGLLKRMWKAPPSNSAFRTLDSMMTMWRNATADNKHADQGLVAAALQLLENLSAPKATDVLLATDLHAGNVLRSTREPWLVIDPKPFIGDRAFDATQHLFNDWDALRRAPQERIAIFADLLDVDATAIRSWLFARMVVESGAWDGPDANDLARRLAP